MSGDLATRLRALPSDTVPPASTNGHGPHVTTVEYTLDDVGNARRLVDQHHENIRYVEGIGWFAWNGRLWDQDTNGALVRFACQTLDQIRADAAAAPDADERKRLWAHAQRSGSKRAVEAMVSLAESDLRIITTSDQLDRDPYLLCVENVTVDLRTGCGRAHQRDDLITKLAPVRYDPDARAPAFEVFIAWAMQDDQERIKLLQRAIGYALTGLTVEQVLFILFGVGSNGKSTLVELLLELMGDYAAQTPPGFLLDDARQSGPSPEVLGLRGTRFAAAAETGDGGRFDEPRIKRMTGGDTVAARYMRSNEIITFRPEFKLFLATNSLPHIREGGHSIWRRIRLIPFEAVITEAERDGHLPDKLRAELPGILNWAIQGCLAWQSIGLGSSTEADAATAKYRASEDHLGSFLAECCELHSDALTRSAELYAAYETWAKSEKEEVISAKSFGTRLERDHGLKPHRTGQTRWRMGVTIIPAGSDA